MRGTLRQGIVGNMPYPRWTDELVITIPAPNLGHLAHVPGHDPALAHWVEVAEMVEADRAHGFVSAYGDSFLLHHLLKVHVVRATAH